MRVIYRVPKKFIKASLAGIQSILSSGGTLPGGVQIFIKEKNGLESMIHLEVSESLPGRSIGSYLLFFFGEISLLPRVTLEHIEFPSDLRLRPAFGLSGLRKYIQVYDRPLFMTILKPAWMWDKKKRDRLVRALIDSGIDIIKEDEILTDVAGFPLRKRAEEGFRWCQYALESRGRPLLFCLNMLPVAGLEYEYIEEFTYMGLHAYLIHPWISGITHIEKLRANFSHTIFFAHPALAGSFFMCSPPRITAECVFGDILTALGFDGILYPVSGGAYALSPDEEERIRKKLHARNIFPIPGGGMTPARIPILLKRYGHDVIINAGRAVMNHPDGPEAGLKAFHQAVEIVQNGGSVLDEKNCPPELKKALQVFA